MTERASSRVSLAILRASIPEPAKDIRVGLEAVLAPGALTPSARWGVAIAAAAAARTPALRDALVAEAERELSPEAHAATVDDALAAAALMAMNNVYYRFRHMIGNPSYSEKPARLRMTRIAKPRGSKAEFELVCLAVSAVAGCEACLRAHEKVALEGGLTEDHVHDAVRIAATVNAAATALSFAREDEALVPEAQAVTS